jgi:hypothetical protein
VTITSRPRSSEFTPRKLSYGIPSLGRSEPKLFKPSASRENVAVVFALPCVAGKDPNGWSFILELYLGPGRRRHCRIEGV